MSAQISPPISAQSAWLGAGPLSFQRRIRWGECDPAGVVYTPRFADYVVEAYQDFLEQLLEGPLQQRFAELDLGTPAMGLNLLFKRSVWPDQYISLCVRVSGVRQRSFDIAVEALDSNGATLFSAVLGLVCVHHAVRESRAIPPAVRERLCSYRDRFPVAPPVSEGEKS